MMTAFIGSALLALTIILYTLLVFGVPWGEYAMGGAQKILSPKNRITAVIAICIQLFGIIVLLQGNNILSTDIPMSAIKTASYFYAVYLTLNVVMNAASRSNKERLLMTPLSAVTAACFWITAISL